MRRQIDLVTAAIGRAAIVVFVTGRFDYLDEVGRDCLVAPTNNQVTLVGTVVDAAYLVVGDRQDLLELGQANPGISIRRLINFCFAVWQMRLLFISPSGEGDHSTQNTTQNTHPTEEHAHRSRQARQQANGLGNGAGKRFWIIEANPFWQ